MGDVKDILGLGGAQGPMSSPPKVHQKEKKPTGMSREVFSLLQTWKSNSARENVGGNDVIVPGHANIFKAKRNQTKVVKWNYAEFSSSARTDGCKFKHWVKASLEFPDYPYAKFNIKPDVITYTAQEYNIVTQNDSSDPNWNKEQTDRLIHLIDLYGLRWNVVTDRYDILPSRSMEDLKERYYSIVGKVLRLRKQQGLLLSPYETKLTEFTFHSDYERRRKRQLEAQHSGVKVDEEREKELTSQLRSLEAAIRKYQKDDSNMSPTKRMAPVSSSIGDIKKEEVDQDDIIWYDGYTATTEMNMGTGVYLQSRRVERNTGFHNYSARKLEKMNALLEELMIPIRPLPTATVCDMYDKLRHDIVKLVTLQKYIASKEAAHGIVYGVSPDPVYHLGNVKLEPEALAVSNKRKQLGKGSRLPQPNKKLRK